MSRRPLYADVRITVGKFDDDGDLISEQPTPEVRRLYKPVGLALQQYWDEIARECKAPEEQKS